MVSNRRKRKILGCFLLFATPIDGLLGVTSAPSLTRKKRRHSKWSFLTSPSSTTRATLRSGKSSWLEAAPHRQVNTNASSPPTESLSSSSPATSFINTNSPTSSASSDARHTDSPLSQIYEDDEHPRAPRPPPSSFSRNEDWLESVTGELLDLDVYPLGKLTDDDVESIAGLMAAWARRKSVTAALTVERLLKRVVDDLKEGNQRVHVTTRMYSCAIDAWAKSGVEGSCERAAQIHDTLVQHYQSTNDPLLAPSVMSFNTVVNAWAKSNHDDAPAKAEAVLEEMIQAYRNGNVALKPDAVTFSTILDAYSKSNKPNAVARCYELFQVMDELDVKRNVYTFSALQNVVARSRIPNAAEQTMNILQQMLKLYENGDVFAKPNTLNYNAVLNACSRTPSKASAQLADDLLHSMELPLIQGGYDVEPDRLSYAMCILACARCPDEAFGVPKAEANLRRMESRAIMEAAKRQQISSAAPPTVTLDIECFNVVLTALSRRKNIPPTRTLEIVKRMEQYAEQGQEHLRPNVRSWNAVLNAYARAIAVSSHSTASNSYAQMAAEFLQHMRLDLGIRPDAFSFAALLSAFQKWDHPEAVAQADALVREMESLFEQNEIDAPPDVYHYTILCGAWARSGQKIAPQRCLQILAHMVERHRLGYPNVKPNVRTYNAVLDCLARAGAEDRAEQLLFHMLKLYRDGDHDAEPDAFTFNCIIHAFSKSRRKGAGRRAESILDRFLEYHEEENQSIRPDTRSFTHIIAHYGRSRELDAPYRAEYVLNRMVSLCKDGNKDLAPNLFAIKTVVDSYSHAKHPDAGRNAERFLNLIRELREKHGITRLERDTSFMNSVLFAWSSCGSEDSGHRAEGHLLEMEDSFDQGTISFRPDSRSYEMVLSAWAKSESSDKAKRALLTLRRMQEQQRTGNPFVRIDEAAYSFVINACAFSNAGEDLEDTDGLFRHVDAFVWRTH